jgi:Tfp pilus assembly protein PilO
LTSLEENREELESKGALPSQTPVEKDLARITRLAQKHRLTLDEIVPQASAEYPGIRELCYSVKGEGRFTDWLAFLRGFETCPFWADITHMKVTQTGQGARAMFSTTRVELTVGFFSAMDVPEEAATEPEDG